MGYCQWVDLLWECILPTGLPPFVSNTIPLDKPSYNCPVGLDIFQYTALRIAKKKNFHETADSLAKYFVLSFTTRKYL